MATLQSPFFLDYFRKTGIYLHMRIVRAVCIFTCLYLFVFPCFSQEHLTLQKEAEASFYKDDYDNALLVGESALNMAELSVGKAHFDYADILCDVAVYNAYTQNFEKAIAQMEEAIELFKKIGGDQSKELSEAESNYGTVLYIAGDYIKAEQHLIKGTEMTKAFHGAVSKDYAISPGNLALVQETGMRKYADAEKNLLLSKSILDKLNLQDSVDYAVMLNNLGSVYQSMGDYLKAEQFYKDAAKADRKNGRDKGLAYTTYYQNFGTLYMNMGRYDDAKAMMQKDLQEKKRLAGEESSEYAAALNNLAELYSNLGNY
ncbi:MAG: tetratricopeptide repeat protein, partial [Phycisphaeraceae bacterium]|nr:tetratricopeptide repeat protein [Phycisphaeraceae bacterium]